MVVLDEYFHHKAAKAPRRCHCGSEIAQSEKSLARRFTDVASPRRRDTSISSFTSCANFNNRQSVPNSFVSLCRCGENRFRFIDHCSLIFERSADAYGNTLIFTAPDTTGNWWGDAAVQSDYAANEIIFCGYRFDPESQIYYVRNRTYHPVLGRWIQRDPIGYEGGINLYEYVVTNPVTKTDTEGRVGVGVIGTGSVGGGLVVGAGATGSAGGGVFIGPQGGSVGGFVSGGAAAGGPGLSYGAPSGTGQTDAFGGAYIGAGAGLFLTNAGKVSQLSGPFWQWNLDLWFASGSFEYSNGVWLCSITAGPAAGAAGTAYSTATATTGAAPPRPPPAPVDPYVPYGNSGPTYVPGGPSWGFW